METTGILGQIATKTLFREVLIIPMLGQIFKILIMEAIIQIQGQILTLWICFQMAHRAAKCTMMMGNTKEMLIRLVADAV